MASDEEGGFRQVEKEQKMQLEERDPRGAPAEECGQLCEQADWELRLEGGWALEAMS